MQQVKRATVFCLAVSTVAGCAIVLSRSYQQRTAARLFERYETAPRVPLPLVHLDTGAGRTLIAAQEWLLPLPPGLPWIETRFLAAQFRDDLCGPRNVALTIRYQGSQPDVDLSEPMTARLQRDPQVPTTLFIAAYDRADQSIRFRGIELAADQAQCLGGLSRVDGLERTPLLLTTALAADWRDEALYQRLR
jgi:hypothetical protein